MSRCGSCPIYYQERYSCYCKGDHGVEECAENLQTLFQNTDECVSNLKQSLADKIKENKELKETAAPAVLDQVLQGVNTLVAQMDYHVRGLAPDGYPVKFNTTGRYQFIGESGSMGLIRGQIYHLTVFRLEGQRIWAKWTVSVKTPRGFSVAQTTKECPYDSADAFNKNWQRIEKE